MPYKNYPEKSKRKYNYCVSRTTIGAQKKILHAKFFLENVLFL